MKCVDINGNGVDTNSQRDNMQMGVNDQIDNAIADSEDTWLGITGHNLRQTLFDNNDEQ